MDAERQDGKSLGRWEPRYRIEACCCDLGVSVTSGAAEKVPTGGELTLIEAVGRVRAWLPFVLSLVAGRGMSGVT
jgi:hypothetical protein